jgi:hypothetical protein
MLVLMLVLLLDYGVMSEILRRGDLLHIPLLYGVCRLRSFYYLVLLLWIQSIFYPTLFLGYCRNS